MSTNSSSRNTITPSSNTHSSNKRRRIGKYSTKKKILKTHSNIKKFNNFYKHISSIEKQTLMGYKNLDYRSINKYLYNHNNIKEFNIDYHDFGENIKSLHSNNTKGLFNYKNISVDTLPKYIELFVNKLIINKIHILDKLFSHKDIYRLSGDEILYRGTAGHTVTNDKNKIGDEVIFNSFTSTTTNKNVTNYFINDYSEDNKAHKKHKTNNSTCCLYILHGLKDVPYIFIPWRNVMKSQMKSHIKVSLHEEFEYLLPRNLKFKIKKIETIIDDNITSSPITFAKLDKIMKHTKINNLYKKINSKIKVYHLEFVEQLPVVSLEPYKYDSKINLHIEKSYSDNSNNVITNSVKKV
jgi:hypothetical protein